MGRVLERTMSRTVALVVAAFAGFLVLGTVFGGSDWVGRMYLVAWALLPFFVVAMGFVVYFENNVLGDDEAAPRPGPLELLCERYARGEIDETEFEEKTERLLETESAVVDEPLRVGESDDR